MNRKCLTVLCLLLATVLSVQDPCRPLWPRVQLGKIYSGSSSSSSSQQKLIIKFNTKSSCQSSYVILENSRSIHKITCQSRSLTITSQNMNNYALYLQYCSVSQQINFEQKLQYLPYGANNTSHSIPLFDNQQEIQISILHPNATRTINMIALADWGQMHSFLENYTSINSTLDHLRVSQQIDVLLINGDIAYDLDSNNGANYEEFMNLLSRIGRYIPVIINTGNHQHTTQQSLKIFYFTFQQYGKQEKLATGLNLGPLFLIGFDPYHILIFENQYRSLRIQTSSILQSQEYRGLKQMIQNGKKTGKVLITSSHYPFVCSASDIKCSIDKSMLVDFFDLMLQNEVKLYLGAHVHIYERTYPYCQNDTFIIKDSPYILDDNCFVSVVEGLGGNNRNMTEYFDNIEPFSASHLTGKTGVALLSVDSHQINFIHYSSENILTKVDQFSILFFENKDKRLQILLEE